MLGLTHGSNVPLSNSGPILNFQLHSYEKVDKGLAESVAVAASILRLVANVDIFATRDGGLRTQAQQALLVKKGVSKTNDSAHLRGLAMDIALYHVQAGEGFRRKLLSKKQVQSVVLHEFLAFLAARYYYFRYTAETRHMISWGGAFHGDLRNNPYTDDMVHFSLVPITRKKGELPFKFSNFGYVMEESLSSSLQALLHNTLLHQSVKQSEREFQGISKTRFLSQFTLTK